ncbi:MAG: hypothetical protein KBA31_09855 [Alphaproteobacteria bacterium]|nr:hypothetical protein [Alphaproteobacteria bacterium]
MTLEQLYYVSQILATVAIFGSLVFVGLQMRARETRYGVMNQILTDPHQSVIAMSLEPLAAQDYYAGHHGGLAALAPERRASHVMTQVGLLHLYERAYVQREAGRLADDAWESIRRQFMAAFTGAASREIWQSRRMSFPPDFAAFLDKEIASAPPVSYVPLVPAAATAPVLSSSEVRSAQP